MYEWRQSFYIRIRYRLFSARNWYFFLNGLFFQFSVPFLFYNLNIGQIILPNARYTVHATHASLVTSAVVGVRARRSLRQIRHGLRVVVAGGGCPQRLRELERTTWYVRESIFAGPHPPVPHSGGAAGQSSGTTPPQKTVSAKIANKTVATVYGESDPEFR